MCGIAGWANLNSERPPIDGDELILDAMCKRMHYRGPDSQGMWLGKGVALGMRRLAIIDLATGEQPMWSEDGTVAVVLNGEIYNYRELRTELEHRGLHFKTNSDTEVLPHLYTLYGDAMIEYLNGMFAFALWDIKQQKLLIARDRFGEKPLYWGIFDRQLIFGSEAKVLLEHPNVIPTINLEALRQYLSFDYVPAPLSIYEGIHKLPAAHFMTLVNGKVEIKRYWQLSFKKPAAKPSIKQASETLQELLSDAVKMRLVSDVPLGILLSGGVDSSAVAAFAVQHSETKIKTFSIGFNEDSFDESDYARQVADYLGTEHHEDRLSVEKASDLVSELGKHIDEPLSDGSLLPTYLLSRFVRSSVTVALGGDGGDEIFAGYPMYYGHKMAKVYRGIPKFVRSGMIEPFVNRLPVNTNNLSFDYKAKRFVKASHYDTVAQHHAWFGSFTPDDQLSLLTEQVKDFSSPDIYAGARQTRLLCDSTNEIEQMQFVDMKYYLAEGVLTKVDRASMAVSLEVRAPFLDHRVAEYAASLPAEYKLRGSTTKFILKNAVKDMMPKFVTKRPKKGFGIPIAEWLKGSLNHLLHDLLAPEYLIRQGFFDHEFVAKIIREHEQGLASHHKLLWTLLAFQLWYDNFIEQKKKPKIAISAQ